MSMHLFVELVLDTNGVRCHLQLITSFIQLLPRSTESSSSYLVTQICSVISFATSLVGARDIG